MTGRTERFSFEAALALVPPVRVPPRAVRPMLVMPTQPRRLPSPIEAYLYHGGPMPAPVPVSPRVGALRRFWIWLTGWGGEGVPQAGRLRSGSGESAGWGSRRLPALVVER